MGNVATTTSPSTPAQKPAQVPMFVCAIREAGTPVSVSERTLPRSENHDPGRDTQVSSTSEAEPSGVDKHPVGSAIPDEEEIAGQFIKLWAAERKVHGTTLRTREELRSLRERLSEQLSYFKTALVAAGRSGRWHAFLRQAKIPRTTADRLVNQHKKAVQPEPEK